VSEANRIGREKTENPAFRGTVPVGHRIPRSRNVRLSPEDVERVVTPYEFIKRSFADLGQYNYLSVFTKAARTLK
jgi:hypothetical protein